MRQTIMGIETEYQVALQGQDGSFHTETVHEKIPAWILAAPFSARTALPQELEDFYFFPRDGKDNFWLGSNGARFYFDIGSSLSEYATPECAGIREVILHHYAGDQFLAEACRAAIAGGFLKEYFPGYEKVWILKLNTHFTAMGAGRTAGCHENYLMSEEGNGQAQFTPGYLGSYIAPFFATRMIFDGTGGIIPVSRSEFRYVLSLRPHFIERISSESAQANRGFFGFKADMLENAPGTIRVHVISGDHTMAPRGKYIAVGATHLVLRAFEEAAEDAWPFWADVDWLSGYRAIADDPSLRATLRVRDRLRGFSEQTALAVQRSYAEFVGRTLRHFSDDERSAFDAWTAMIAMLEQHPEDAADKLDWCIKLEFLRERCGGKFSSVKARWAADFYHVVTTDGLYHRLQQAGRAEAFLTKEEIRSALFSPPKTRAAFRSRYIKTFYRAGMPWAKVYSWGRVGDPGGFIGISDPTVYGPPQGEAIIANFLRRKNVFAE